MLALVILAGIFLINIIVFPPESSKIVEGSATFTVVDKFTLSVDSNSNNYVRLYCESLGIQIMVLDNQLYKRSLLGTYLSLPYKLQNNKYTFPTTNCISVEYLSK